MILVDYLSILGHNTSGSSASPFTSDERAAFQRIQAALDRAHELAANRTSAELVRISALSVDHALGPPEPWVFDFTPDMEGMTASFH